MTQTSKPTAGGTPRDSDAALVVPILLGVVVFLALWGTSIALWGVPGLYIPAVIMVPVIWVGLLLISRG
ncbi:hypothetical protein SAMN05444414_10242 [Roseovarius marisflavi]|uniref:Uncharacterized protein n=1 Tax=Roseovarius marisflavi TaxID=1054996 RepID=A0A1M6W107_9RHOB|nr:hypothetical protein [Roseovarius marisflavi]SHK87306.1 hypothetical protein SAMN05444414_10242 [Roseovarius marisflavi]